MDIIRCVLPLREVGTLFLFDNLHPTCFISMYNSYIKLKQPLKVNVSNHFGGHGNPWLLAPYLLHKKRDELHSSLFGGGHGTRTHGAVTPYLISNQAP